MPSLKQYVGQREVLPKGRYVFTLDEVVYEEDADREYQSVQLKGTIDDKKHVIFRRCHPKQLWVIAQELTKLGHDPEDGEANPEDPEWVAAAYEAFVGTSMDVQAKVSHYEGNDRNEFMILGPADGAASGRV